MKHITKLNREELAWAAGLFDGEGNFRTWVANHKATNKALDISVAQTDTRVLERFQRAVLGLGKIYGPEYRKGESWKPVWRYRAGGFETGQAVIAMLYQFLSPVKQAQAIKVLKEMKESHALHSRVRTPQ
jgi:hypothetical protein